MTFYFYRGMKESLFWLRLAGQFEQAYNRNRLPPIQGICDAIDSYEMVVRAGSITEWGNTFRGLFRPDTLGQASYYWPRITRCEDDRGTCYGRVLALGFMYAMALDKEQAVRRKKKAKKRA